MRISEHPAGFVFFKTIWAAIIITALLASPCPVKAAGETHVSVALGISPIKKDAASARESAVAQGLAAALEKTVLQLMPLEQVTEKFDTLGPLLTDHRDDFIQDYKVLKESNDGKTYRVLVQATVLNAKLQQALGGEEKAKKEEGGLKVLFMMSEQEAGEPSPHSWWQGGDAATAPSAAVEGMKQALSEKGFDIINEKALPLTQLNDLHLTGEPTDAQILETAKRAGADVVVSGTAVAVEAPRRTGETMLTLKGTVTARPVMVATGEPLPTVINTQTALHPNKTGGSRQALTNAGKQAGLEIAPKILVERKAEPTAAAAVTGGDILINLIGPDVLPYLPAFRTALKNISGVTRHQPLEMSPGKAVLKVGFDGGPHALADALVLESFDDFSISISEVAGNQITVELTVP